MFHWRTEDGDAAVSSADCTSDVLVCLDGRVLEAAVVGGKGAALSRLVAIGAPVPPAFALTVEAYAEMARAARIPATARNITVGDLAEIRATIESAPLPNRVREAVHSAYARLGLDGGVGTSVAVRSSASAEDSADTSFAGLHDSILDVRGNDAVEHAIRQTWASLWTERALAYRRHSQLEDQPAQIAVVVQQLIPSEISFVAFSVDPLSGRTDHVVINATWGLGESIVSGIATPDHIVVDQRGVVCEYRIGEKSRMVIPGSDGTGPRTVSVPRLLRILPALAEAQVSSITRMVRDLAARLGHPADFEGGTHRGGEIALFQARPITTLGTAAC